MKRLVLWLALVICACASVAQADDPAKQADAKARRESVLAQRRAMRAQIQIEKAAYRRQRLIDRQTPPRVWWWIEWGPSLGNGYRPY